jgi:hypothetical protein
MENPKGDARVIQMKDVDLEFGVKWNGLARTLLTGKRRPNWVEPGDILFVARGFRNFSLHVAEVPEPVVLAPHFFHITLKPGAEVLPGFLAWQINQGPAQQYLKISAEGSNVPSIRRSTLEEMPIAVPALEKQALITRLDTAYWREQQILRELSENMKQTMNGLARELLREA